LYSFTNIIFVLLVNLLTNKMLPRTVLTTPLFLVGPTHGDNIQSDIEQSEQC